MRLPLFAVVSTIAVFAGAGMAAAQEAAERDPALNADTSVDRGVDPDADVSASEPVTLLPSGMTGERPVTEAQIYAYGKAMVTINAVTRAAGDEVPTLEQRSEMTAAIEETGLGVDQFNTIAAQVAKDPVLQARAAVISSPESAAGSVGASVSDEEVEQFASAMAKVRRIAAGSRTSTAAQQTQMATAIQSEGLTRERFTAISGAVSRDAHLQARIQLVEALRDAN